MRSRYAFIVMLALAALLVAASPSSAFAAWSAPITGTAWSAGGDTAAGVAVTVYMRDFNTPMEANRWNAVARTRTGADGTFSVMPMADLPEGGYYAVLFTDPIARFRSGFAMGQDVPWLDSAPESLVSSAASDAWPMGPGSDASRVLQPIDSGSGTIRGDMFDQLTGLEGSGYIHIYRWNDDSQTWTYAGRTGTFSSGRMDGRYEFYGTLEDGKPVAGRFRLQFRNLNDNTYLYEFWERGATVEEGSDVVVRPGQVVTVDFGARRKAPVVGHVYGPDGRPVSNALIDVYEQNASGVWETVHSVDSLADGRFVLYTYGDAKAGVPVRFSVFDRYRRYTTTFYGGSTNLEGARTLVPTGLPMSGIDVYMGGRPAIAGSALDSATGRGIPDLKVTAFRRLPGAVWSWDAETYTDGNGTYHLPVDGGGAYRVEFSDTKGTMDPADDDLRYYPGSATIDSASDVTVPANGVASGVSVSLTGFGNGLAERLYGSDRYGTALAISAATFPSAVTSTAVIASGETFPDALSASALAGAFDAPLLVTRKTQLPPGTIAELSRLGAWRVIVVGGPSAVATSVVDSLRAAGLDVERVAGADRYETSARVAERVELLQPSASAFVTRGDTFADALSVAPMAYATHRPVLLVRPDALPASVGETARSLGVTEALVLGSERAVGASVITGLGTYGMQARRIADGIDRYDTGARAARYAVSHGWLSPVTVGVARGDTFPDALGGGAALGSASAPLLLTAPTSLSAYTKGCLVDWKPQISSIRVFGSPGAVSSSVVSQLGR
jgi:putative cell wall-binding protein